jgi:signal transduction histidine kinase/ActR/RegA family two-component response regulator
VRATAQDRLERRVLLLAPTGRDGPLTQAVLQEHGLDASICADIDALCQDVGRGAGAVLVADEGVLDEGWRRLAAVVARQPRWSDLPVLVLTRPGSEAVITVEALESLGNVTLLERPVRVAMLVSAVRVALRARDRQYQIRAHLVQQQRAEAALREADRRKDEFLAMLAHELRNPLAPIRNAVDALQLSDTGDGTLERVRDIMRRQVNHMVRLVDDLLEISRITRGKIELRKQRIDLSAVIASAIETSRPLIESAGHVLHVNLPDESVPLDADPMRLAQVFSNLLNNAAKYTDVSGEIWLDARCEGAVVVIAVRDAGIGIPAEMLPHVFEMFAQEERSRRRAQGGLGIGLTLVKSLTEMHGGSVHAWSDGPGKGSEFEVRLPVLSLAADEKTGKQERGRPSRLAALRVLVVDDNIDAADSLGLLLKLLGADSHVVHDGPSALEAIGWYRPTVVLLDLGMPGMDGYEVARRIRQQGPSRDLPLIALTGWGQEEDRRRTEMAGFTHHLVKPADAQTLQGLLEELQVGPPAGKSRAQA